MLCPACLSFGTSTDAVATVGGTDYCAQHAPQALAQQLSGRRPGSSAVPGPGMGIFSPPTPAEPT